MINLDNKPKDLVSLFFGDAGGIARLDIGGSERFKKLAEVDEANFWGLNTISCSQDRITELPSVALSKFQKNLAYQTVVDSLVPNVYSWLSEIANDPWLSYLYSRVSTMEKVHAMSYSSGINQAFGAQAEQFLDIIYTDKVIKSRITDEVEVVERFIVACKEGFSYTEDNAKLLVEVLLRVFFLEGVKFPFSFFTTWTINRSYDNVAQGFSLLLLEIAKDEMQTHTTTGSSVLNLLRHDPRFACVFSTGWFEDMVNTIALQTTQKDIMWAEYLLADGEMPGFNLAICEHFIKYWVDRRLKELKLNPIHKVVKNDIEDWFDAYRNIASKSTAKQEADSVSYQTGRIVDDLHRFDS